MSARRKGSLGGPRLRPLGAAVQLLLFANLVINAVEAWEILHRVDVLDDYRAGRASLADLGAADDTVHAWSIADVVALVVTGVLFIVWFAIAHRAAERCNPQVLRYGRGWAIGAWITPILGLWRPPKMVNDVLAGLEEPPGAGWGPRAHRLVTAWWLTLIIGDVIERFNPDWSTVSELRRWSRVEELSVALTLPAAVLAIVLVQRISSLADQRRSESSTGVSSPSPVGGLS